MASSSTELAATSPTRIWEPEHILGHCAWYHPTLNQAQKEALLEGLLDGLFQNGLLEDEGTRNSTLIPLCALACLLPHNDTGEGKPGHVVPALAVKPHDLEARKWGDVVRSLTRRSLLSALQDDRDNILLCFTDDLVSGLDLQGSIRRWSIKNKLHDDVLSAAVKALDFETLSGFDFPTLDSIESLMDGYHKLRTDMGQCDPRRHFKQTTIKDLAEQLFQKSRQWGKEDRDQYRVDRVMELVRGVMEDLHYGTI